jgi:hypothetical protein
MTIEIPLLRESSVFAARLMKANRHFSESTYENGRRCNWSYKYGDAFYRRESELFLADPDSYLAGRVPEPSDIEDVYAQRLKPKQFVIATVKVAAHWLFAALGARADRKIKSDCIRTYRKGYVDDIELVFDPEEPSVVRAIYPFPLNLRRQLRYIWSLHRSRRRFKLAGYPYLVRDVVRLWVRRDVRSLMRLESRSQIRHAAQVVALGVKAVQLSEEFDIGSLDFSRRLARSPIDLRNSAHGVGKYLPVHSYPSFDTVTKKQQTYYRALCACCYSLRRLNDRSEGMPAQATGHDAPRLVFLSQCSKGVSGIVSEAEARVTRRLAEALASTNVELLYKRHPNSTSSKAPQGFRLLDGLTDVNGLPGTTFVSFFSTCQVDPAFKGRKVLLREHLIYPEIVFDESEEIVDTEGLVRMMQAAATAEVPP